MLSHRGQTETSIMIRSMTRGLTAAALAAALCVAGTASAQEDQSPLSAIGRMFGKKQQTTGQEETEGPTTEQVLRIERLEAQIRQLTGTIEQLQYRNQQLENQLRGAGTGAPGLAAAQPVTIRAALRRYLGDLGSAAGRPQRRHHTSTIFDYQHESNAPEAST